MGYQRRTLGTLEAGFDGNFHCFSFLIALLNCTSPIALLDCMGINYPPAARTKTTSTKTTSTKTTSTKTTSTKTIVAVVQVSVVAGRYVIQNKLTTDSTFFR